MKRVTRLESMTPFIESPEKPPFGDKCYSNGKYQAVIRFDSEYTILTVRREDRYPIFDWRDMQWIKNQLLGPEVEAVQLFPAESRLVDTANQYYLFARRDGQRFPFGFESRAVSENITLALPGHSSSQQRPFAEHVRPADLDESERMIGVILKDLKCQLRRNQ